MKYVLDIHYSTEINLYKFDHTLFTCEPGESFRFIANYMNSLVGIESFFQNSLKVRLNPAIFFGNYFPKTEKFYTQLLKINILSFDPRP